MNTAGLIRTKLGTVTVFVLLFGYAFTGFTQTDSRPARRDSRFEHGPKPGSAAPDFELKTVDGKTLRASALWSNKPTVIMAGSHTCPVFRGKVEPFESLVSEFSNRVNFVVLYTQEAHPKGDPSPYRNEEWVTPANRRDDVLFGQPKSLEERTARARACATALKLNVAVVVDTMDNSMWRAYGSAPNSACLVGRDGKVIQYEGWFDPAKMRVAIERSLEKSVARKPKS
jgi:hypothetical protein